MTQNQKKQVLMLVACDVHSETVLNALDQARVSDWVILPTAQCRRMGLLEYLPSRRERSCEVIMGIADAPAVAATLDTLVRAVSHQQICPNCLAYVWETSQVRLANAALDPICGMAVDRDQALSAEYEGASYYFCTPECREQFLRAPDAYINKDR